MNGNVKYKVTENFQGCFLEKYHKIDKELSFQAQEKFSILHFFFFILLSKDWRQEQLTK